MEPQVGSEAITSRPGHGRGPIQNHMVWHSLKDGNQVLGINGDAGAPADTHWREFPFSTLPLRQIIRQRPSRYKLKSPSPFLGGIAANCDLAPLDASDVWLPRGGGGV